MAHGALIIFSDEMSKEECDAILRRMFNANEIHGGMNWDTRKVEPPKAKNFNPDHGSPCWYIP
jgi:hypothetical protein